jgi:hypothetical protein
MSRLLGISIAVAKSGFQHRTKAADLAEPVEALIDPQGRRRQFVAARLVNLTGTRAGGFVLTREEPAGHWGVSTYALIHT